jgi:hypothetical protein
MSLKTILAYAAAAFTVWWVVLDTQGAADLVQHIGGFLSAAASGLSHFVSSI